MYICGRGGTAYAADLKSAGTTLRVQISSPTPNLLKKRGIKMNKVIEWLFYRTPDGATYLQVISMVLILIFLINYLFKCIKDIVSCIILDDKDGENNV